MNEVRRREKVMRGVSERGRQAGGQTDRQTETKIGKKISNGEREETNKYKNASTIQINAREGEERGGERFSRASIPSQP